MARRRDKGRLALFTQLNESEVARGLDAVIYDRLMEKEQTMLDAIDRGCLEGGYLDDEDLRIIFERLLGEDAKGLEY